ncbi:translation initiation factor eIF-2B [Halomicroarcula sp. GCM10025817]|uniref:translation initiation factor eIF-2B n=1 Tax=Haloarcula TaxID=2237 RepID=UPI0023E788BA|nr:translation initiation factor eIF-2B [Halomicroarcula sp. SYNS111]
MIDETVKQIEEMQTHSSSVVAVKAAKALQTLTERDYPTVEAYLRTLERNSHALQRANPSHASLHTTQEEIVQRVGDADPEDVEAAKAVTLAAIDDVVTDVEGAKDRAAERAAEFIADDDVLLLHDFSSTVMAALDEALAGGATFEIYVTESRPRMLGRKAARQLAQREGIDVTLIVDSAAGYYVSECDRVLLGMTCIVGDTYYNRVGTYQISTAAVDAGVPITVVGAGAKLVEGGFAFKNEFRPVAEVMREPAEGFELANPAYDATPTELLDSVVTDDQVYDY